MLGASDVEVNRLDCCSEMSKFGDRLIEYGVFKEIDALELDSKCLAMTLNRAWGATMSVAGYAL